MRKTQFHPHGPIQGWHATGAKTAFMVPSAEWLTQEEAQEYIEDADEDHTEGWYARLTAPGYMDATDWQGPYPSFFRAIRDLCRTFEVDLDGRDL